MLFGAIFFSFRFTIGLNTLIVSRLEFFGGTLILRTRIAGGLLLT